MSILLTEISLNWVLERGFENLYAFSSSMRKGDSNLQDG